MMMLNNHETFESWRCAISLLTGIEKGKESEKGMIKY